MPQSAFVQRIGRAAVHAFDVANSRTAPARGVARVCASRGPALRYAFTFGHAAPHAADFARHASTAHRPSRTPCRGACAPRVNTLHPFTHSPP
ncbi:hypothetical protein BDI4_740025 [Burkholderia diffusa]|nr:hypothetical protein BDI4_740025 [Burkholderia diffusa]